MGLPTLARALVDFAYPHQCTGCGQPATDTLCPACNCELLELESEGACPRCAMPLVYDDSPCPYCLAKGIHPLDQILRLAVFVEPVKTIIHHMKYHNRWHLAETFAERLFAHPDIRDLVTSSDVLVPVPLHWRKQVKRGYNQSEVLARRLARLAGRKPVLRAVRRIIDTPTQTGLRGQADRWENVRNAFRLKSRYRSRLAGKRAVVIDDVMTTGSTLKAVARQLALAKPANLSGVVLAIADPKGRGFEVV